MVFFCCDGQKPEMPELGEQNLKKPSSTTICCVLRAALLSASWQIQVIAAALTNGRWATQHARTMQCEKALKARQTLTCGLGVSASGTSGLPVLEREDGEADLLAGAHLHRPDAVVKIGAGLLQRLLPDVAARRRQVDHVQRLTHVRLRGRN